MWQARAKEAKEKYEKELSEYKMNQREAENTGETKNLPSPKCIQNNKATEADATKKAVMKRAATKKATAVKNAVHQLRYLILLHIQQCYVPVSESTQLDSQTLIFSLEIAFMMF